MLAKVRTEEQHESDIALMAELLARGVRKVEIARRLNVSPTTITRDLERVEEIWRRKAEAKAEVWKSRELAKIEEREHAAWEEFEKSRQEMKKTTVQTKDKDAQGKVVTRQVTTETRCGDPRYLDIIARCSKDRRELLGLDAPGKQETAAVVISCKLPQGLDPTML